MATIVLSAAGMALGGSIGGTTLGLSNAVIGRAIGATLGRVIDQRVMGGSDAVETGRIDRFRLTGASEGSAIPQIHGQMRVGGQVIWATRFLESTTTTGGSGKGSRQPSVTNYAYTVSLAIAVCEGPITRIGRIWADGVEIAADDLTLRVYKGGEDQLPDPKIEAVEGTGNAPAYRGTAYVVIEDLNLGLFGNRIPQFSFEVVKTSADDIAQKVRGVALIPGTGEYALATTPVTVNDGLGAYRSLNVHTAAGKADIEVSLDALADEAPNLSTASLIVSWFGDDLRCGSCRIGPRAETLGPDPIDMPWQVSGADRATAGLVPYADDRPVYGGTPTDQSVVQAIQSLTARRISPVFYPFVLMEQLSDNTLPDPWGAATQPALPWRGRITLSLAPTQSETPDQTALAEAEVAAFFGTAQVSDFAINGTSVTYTGPAEWSYRRFILHYAHLCAAAGGVGVFCIGSELRGLTEIRGANGFPAVNQLRQLAAEVKAILPNAKITYAADWSEYHGMQPAGTADKLFHLDALWADPNIDFIGIDNYLPLSDWRDGLDHLDAHWGDIRNLDYLRSNVEGGELYDWFYHSPEARAAQIRTPITDGEGEPWIWRPKDIRNWWSNPHYNRIDGVKQATPTDWVPMSKPIVFTEYGCAAIDKGTNQPNKFLDPKSSESGLPYYSTGGRDDALQAAYITAIHDHYADPSANPVSPVYGGAMVDMSLACLWAWDARPYPAFPNNRDLWSDGANYARGHWMNGRLSARSLAQAVADICQRAGVAEVDVSRLYGVLRGYMIDQTDTARAALQPLMLAYGFDVTERDGKLTFVTRTPTNGVTLSPDDLVIGDRFSAIEHIRAPEAEVAGKIRLSYVGADGTYVTRLAEASLAGGSQSVARSEAGVVLTAAEASQITDRWLTEQRMARDTVTFALPPSRIDVAGGDVVTLRGDSYRIDRMTQSLGQEVEATRIDTDAYIPSLVDDLAETVAPVAAPLPVTGVFLDLPLLTGTEIAHAPHFAATAVHWPGAVALYHSETDSDYRLAVTAEWPATIGTTLTTLDPAMAGRWDHGAALRVQLVRGELSSTDRLGVLSGRNAIAIGDGSADGWEVFQFQEAVLVAPNTYDLGLRLRGQQGTEAVYRPAGSMVVLLDGALAQPDYPSTLRGVTRSYRFGPATRGYDDPTYQTVTSGFAGNGLRPYPVCHLTSRGEVTTWVRRTRVDGDSWDAAEVPLGEDREAYVVRIFDNGDLKREVIVTAPEFTYSASDKAADGVTGGYTVQVAQLSDRYGAGPYRSLWVA